MEFPLEPEKVKTEWTRRQRSNTISQPALVGAPVAFLTPFVLYVVSKAKEHRVSRNKQPRRSLRDPFHKESLLKRRWLHAESIAPTVPLACGVTSAGNMWHMSVKSSSWNIHIGT